MKKQPAHRRLFFSSLLLNFLLPFLQSQQHIRTDMKEASEDAELDVGDKALA